MASRLVPVLAVVLSAALLACAPAAWAGGDGDDLPARAERLEREGKALLEAGKRVEGAKAMAEAWRLRAEHFAREAREDVGRRIDALREESARAEKEAHALRDAGKKDEAERLIEVAGKRWKEAEALAAGLREKAAAAVSKDELARRVEDGKKRLHALEARRKELEAKAAELWADGKEAAAEESLAAAKRLRDEAATVERELGKLAKEAGRAAEAKAEAAKARAPEAADAMRQEIERLGSLVEKLRAEVGRLRERLEEAPAPK